MSAVKLLAFAGMVPALDPRLLPDDAAADAQNVWFYNGDLEGIRVPRLIFTPGADTRAVFRIPKNSPDLAAITDSWWLQFDTIDVSVVKSPVLQTDDPAYYWASTSDVPRYSPLSNIEVNADPLILGIPAPAIAPTVTPAGGVGATETRAYVYTWVSDFGEEGPPSPPTVETGKVDDTWTIDMTAPTGGDTTDRQLGFTRIYRTVTGSTGVASYYFVVELPIATLTYDDTFPDSDVINAGVLESTDWTGPPDTLEGLAALPNGILAGWTGNEVWFSEPYRPHAWPAKYQISVGYNIVAMVGSGQSLIIGTEAYPYIATGVSPSSMTLARIPDAQPCLSRNSMVGSPLGVYYASPNGLISIVPTGAIQNVTRETVSKQEWQELLNLHVLRAALLNGAYIVYGGVTETAFQIDTFQNDAFQLDDSVGTRQGALVEFVNPRVGFSRLLATETVYNVTTDAWTGEVLLLLGSGVYVLDLTNPEMSDYSWTSKIFSLPFPENLGALKVTYEAPLGITSPSGTITVFANGVQRLSRAIPASDQVFRMPSGFKANTYQFAITGNLVIKSIQIGSTIRDLRQV